ncbi:MAG: hypothetical protein HRU38_23315 [Saccharospirillaceae bacterium]|nr:hypothetical protein [Saccharospirillaceae bacterium]
MNIGTEFKTTRGIATCVGHISSYIVSIHLDPTCESDKTYSGNIDILLADKNAPEKLLGFLSLNEFVECAVDDGFVTEDKTISLSPEDCKIIDELSWQVLIEKYRIAPTQFVTGS